MARPQRKYKYLGSRGNKHPVMSNRFSPSSLTKKLRKEMEAELLKRKLARFRRHEMRSRGLPAPVRGLPEELLRSEEASDALAQIEAANKAAASITQPFPTDFTQGRQGQGGVSMGADYRTLPGTFPRDHGQGDFPGRGAELNQRGMKGEPWVMPQDKRKILQQQAIARDLAEREAEQLELQNRRPAPEQWMTGRLGLQDPTWTSKAPGVDAQQAANMAQARRRELNLAAPGLEGQVFDDDRPTGAEIQAGVQGLLGQYPENVSGAVPDYGYWEQRANTLRQRKREEDFAKSQRDQATAFEQMEPTQPSYAYRSIAKIFGLPMAGTAAIINPLLEMLGAPEDIIAADAPMSEAWILQRLQTTSPIAFEKIKKALKQVYPAVEETITETIPSVVEEASQAVGGMVDKVPPLMGELQQWAEENVKPVTQQIGRDFDRRYALKQEGAEAIASGPDDPGLLTDSGRQLDVGGLLRLAEEGDVTSVPPSERPQKGLGFPGPQAGASDASKDYVPPSATTKEDQKKVIVDGVNPDASTVGGNAVTQLDPATRAGLERVWGKHTYNPAQRRKKYMAQLNSIYKKAAWLDAIAAVSGGQSRSASYIERAVGMMETMQKFDQEERVYNIWRDVYYDKSGNYDPPKSKKEAAERARRLGANPEEVKSIYGWAEEEEDLQQWWRPDGKGGYETTYTRGKKARPAAGSGAAWEMGSEPSQMHAADKAPKLIWAVPPGGGAAQYVDERVVASQQGWTRPTKEGGRALERAIAKAEEHLAAGNEAAARSELKLFFTGDPMNVIVFGKNIDKTIDEQIANIREARGISDGAAKEQQQQQAAGPATLEEAVSMAIAHPSNAGKNPQEVRFDVEVWWQKNRGGG